MDIIKIFQDSTIEDMGEKCLYVGCEENKKIKINKNKNNNKNKLQMKKQKINKISREEKKGTKNKKCRKG